MPVEASITLVGGARISAAAARGLSGGMGELGGELLQMSQGGGLVTFEVKGGVEQGRRFLDALELFSLSPNLGDTRSIATHPASTTHVKLTEEARLAVGITPGLIRISTGLEHIQDIVADVEQALERSLT